MISKNIHVAVLMGGKSAEREVSLISGNAVEKTLLNEGYRVTTIDVCKDLDSKLQKSRPDVVFNALHGRWGEDGCVQGLLELLAIPYTHSGVTASAIAMNKALAKGIFTAAGIRCPKGSIANRYDILRGKIIKPPFVVKPINQGSSVGVLIIQDESDLEPLKNKNWNWGDEVLIENYIPGRDIQVAVMGQKALGAIEIRPKGKFYDYEAKYTQGKAEHIMPAPINSKAYNDALEIALSAHFALGCRSISRADLRYDDSQGEPGKLFMLEINTQPGLTPLSLFPEIAQNQGVSFNKLIEWLIEEARCDS